MLAVLGGLLAGAEQDYARARHHPGARLARRNRRLGDAGAPAGRTLPAILHVDTGMSRLGLDARELATLQQDHARLAGIDLRYVMTHLVSSEVADDPLNERQRERFAAACAGLPPAPRSFANSSGIFLGAGFGSDLARPGSALYGINPTPGAPNPMRLAVRLSARVLAVRDIAGRRRPSATTPPGRAARPSRIATVGDRLRRWLAPRSSNRGRAFFDGTPRPAGRPCVHGPDHVRRDRSSRVVRRQPGWNCSARRRRRTTWPRAAGTNGYEVLTSLGRRFHRVYSPA